MNSEELKVAKVKQKRKEINNLLIKDVLKSFFKEEYREKQKENSSRAEQCYILNEKESEILAGKIKSLSVEFRQILMFYYGFRHSVDEIEEIMEYKDVGEKLSFIDNILAKSLQLKGKRIAASSMSLVCEKLLYEEVREAEEDVKYTQLRSTNFFVWVKRMFLPLTLFLLFPKARNREYRRKIIQNCGYVACAVLLFLICTPDIVKSRIWEWTLQTFETHTTILLQSDEDPNNIKLSDVRIKYVPSGMKLDKVLCDDRSMTYHYTSENHKEKLFIDFFNIKKLSKFSFDTENAELEKIELNGRQAYYWKKGKCHYLMWQEDGIRVCINYTLGKEEMLKIAENIKKR